MKLTICIQTFNRSNYLNDLLESIPIDSSVQILVGDYSTEKEHIELNQKNCKKWKNLVYYQGKNAGLDYGFSELMLKAQTEYCWLLPDDDLVDPSTIDQLLATLKQHDPALLLVNSSVYTEGFVKNLKSSTIQLNLEIIQLEQMHYKKFVHMLSYVGSCIFKREYWLKYMDSQYLGTYFNHVYVAVEIISQGAKVCVTNLVCVKIRANNALWTENAFHIWTYHWPQSMSKLFNQKSENIKRIETKTLLYYFAYGALDQAAFKKHAKGKLIANSIAFMGKTFAATLVFTMVSIHRGSLISEPGYYILKANKNFLSKLILRVFYSEK